MQACCSSWHEPAERQAPQGRGAALQLSREMVQQASKDVGLDFVGGVEERPRGNPAVASAEVMYGHSERVFAQHLV